MKERARRENRTAGEVLSDLARQALTQQHSADLRTGADPSTRSQSFSNGGRFVTLDQSIPIDAVHTASARNLALI